MLQNKGRILSSVSDKGHSLTHNYIRTSLLTSKLSPLAGQKYASHLLVLGDVVMQLDPFVLIIIISPYLVPLWAG